MAKPGMSWSSAAAENPSKKHSQEPAIQPLCLSSPASLCLPKASLTASVFLSLTYFSRLQLKRGEEKLSQNEKDNVEEQSMKFSSWVTA